MWSFDDNLSLAADRVYGSVKEILAELEQFLKAYT
jgi:hypothetical protein